MTGLKSSIFSSSGRCIGDGMNDVFRFEKAELAVLYGPQYVDKYCNTLELVFGDISWILSAI